MVDTIACGKRVQFLSDLLHVNLSNVPKALLAVMQHNVLGLRISDQVQALLFDCVNAGR